MTGKHHCTQKELSDFLGISKTLFATCNKEAKFEAKRVAATVPAGNHPHLSVNLMPAVNLQPADETTAEAAPAGDHTVDSHPVIDLPLADPATAEAEPVPVGNHPQHAVHPQPSVRPRPAVHPNSIVDPQPVVDGLQQAMSRKRRKDAVPPGTIKAIQDYWIARSFPTANVRDQLAVR
jgi:hypothetical protein